MGTIEIPLVQHNHRYSIYEIDTFWIPAASGSGAATRIDQGMIPNYIAINHDGSGYFEINTINMNKDFIFEESLVSGLRPDSTQTCLWAVTSDKRDLVKSLCKFDFRAAGLKPAAFRLANDRL